MAKCWATSPDKRLSFCALEEAINSSLDGIAGYLDLSIDKGWQYDHLQCYDKLSALQNSERGYDQLRR